MKTTLKINLEDTKTTPRSEIHGSYSWKFSKEPSPLELRLFWYTEGKGTEDSEVISTKDLHPNQREGEAAFNFILPEGPLTYRGKLISILWAIELFDTNTDDFTRAEFELRRIADD